MIVAARRMQRVIAGGRLTHTTDASFSSGRVAYRPASATIIVVGVRVYADSRASGRQVGVVASYKVARMPVGQVAEFARRADVAASSAIVLIMEDIGAMAVALVNEVRRTAEACMTILGCARTAARSAIGRIGFHIGAIERISRPRKVLTGVTVIRRPRQVHARIL
jgi:hypothetical protein